MAASRNRPPMCAGSKHPSSDRCHHRALPAVGALAAWNFQGDEGMDCFPVPIVAFPREGSTRAQKPTGPLSGDIRTSTTISNLHHYTLPSPETKYNGDANTLQTLPFIVSPDRLYKRSRQCDRQLPLLPRYGQAIQGWGNYVNSRF
jgi:hypothetical protein